MRNLKISITKDTRKDRNGWLVRWWGEYDPTIDKQKRYCKSFPKKKLAEMYVEEKKKEFGAGMSVDRHDITLAELCEKFIDVNSQFAQSTSNAYIETIYHLKNYFYSDIPIRLITVENAEAFINNLKLSHENHINRDKILSDSSRNRHYRQCRTMFNTAQRWGYIKKNPFNEVSLGKIRTQPWHFITPDEFKSLLNVVDNLRVRKKAQEQDEARIVRLKAFYSVMYGCGLRFGEAVNLLWNGDNIDFDKKQINLTNRPGTKILPIFKVKDYEARSIPMPNWVVDSLIELKPYAEEGCPFTFLTKTSWNRVKSKWMMLRKAGETKKWNNKDLMGHALRYFKKYCKFAGIKTNKKLTLHGLRKGYGTNLANMSTPAHTLKELMGHSSITTTMKYYLFSPDANKKKAVEGLDELMQ